MRVVIVEDESAALEQLKMVLRESQEQNIEIVAELDSVEESIEFFRSDLAESVDLIFMDIHLSDGYAFSIFKHVTILTPIIFTTAYDEYALQAFKVNCLGYTLKPISAADIETLFAKIKVIAHHSRVIEQSRYVDTLLVGDSWRTRPLAITEIACFYSSESKVRVFDLNGRSYSLNRTLERLEEQLDGDLFMRANRQFILSRAAVLNIESWDGNRALVNLTIASPERVIVSRTKVTLFKRWLSRS